MKSINFHLHESGTLVSRLICWWLNTKYSHVSVEVEGVWYQSYWGLDFYKTTVKPTDIKKTVHLSVDDNKAKAVVDMLDSKLGERYDYKSIVSWVFRINHQARKYWYCSEVAKVALDIVTGSKVKYDRMIKPEEITTAALYFSIGKQQS